MSLLKPRNRRQRQRSHNTNEGRKKLGTPDNRRSAWPEELDPLIRLIQVFLGGDVVFVGAGVGEGGEMGEVEFCGEMDVGFVEPGGDEEEGEDLVDFYEEDLGFLVVFFFFPVSSAFLVSLFPLGLHLGLRLTVAFYIQHYPWRENLIPSVDHPYNPS
jgi:hypothetical protein